MPVMLVGVVLISGVVGSGAYGSNPQLGVADRPRDGRGVRRLPAGDPPGQPGPPARGPGRDRDGRHRRSSPALFGAAIGDLDLAPGLPALAYLLALGSCPSPSATCSSRCRCRRLPAVITSVLLLVQPVTTMLLGAILLAEAAVAAGSSPAWCSSWAGWRSRPGRRARRPRRRSPARTRLPPAARATAWAGRSRPASRPSRRPPALLVRAVDRRRPVVRLAGVPAHLLVVAALDRDEHGVRRELRLRLRARHPRRAGVVRPVDRTRPAGPARRGPSRGRRPRTPARRSRPGGPRCTAPPSTRRANGRPSPRWSTSGCAAITPSAAPIPNTARLNGIGVITTR